MSPSHAQAGGVPTLGRNNSTAVLQRPTATALVGSDHRGPTGLPNCGQQVQPTPESRLRLVNPACPGASSQPAAENTVISKSGQSPGAPDTKPRGTRQRTTQDSGSRRHPWNWQHLLPRVTHGDRNNRTKQRPGRRQRPGHRKRATKAARPWGPQPHGLPLQSAGMEGWRGSCAREGTAPTNSRSKEGQLSHRRAPHVTRAAVLGGGDPRLKMETTVNTGLYTEWGKYTFQPKKPNREQGCPL